MAVSNKSAKSAKSAAAAVGVAIERKTLDELMNERCELVRSSAFNGSKARRETIAAVKSACTFPGLTEEQLKIAFDRCLAAFTLGTFQDILGYDLDKAKARLKLPGYKADVTGDDALARQSKPEFNALGSIRGRWLTIIREAEVKTQSTGGGANNPRGRGKSGKSGTGTGKPVAETDAPVVLKSVVVPRATKASDLDDYMHVMVKHQADFMARNHDMFKGDRRAAYLDAMQTFAKNIRTADKLDNE